MRISLAGILLISLFFFTCSKKAIKTTTPSASVSTPSSLVQSVNSKGIRSRWIQAKAQVALDGGGFMSSGSAAIRSCKDSILWISISKLGMEVFRGIILQDSAFWINEWEHTFWKGSIEDIKNKYKIPADLGDLQDLLFPMIDPLMEYEMNKKDQTLILSQPGLLQKKYEISDQTFLIQQLYLTHLDTDLKLEYADYKLNEDYWFPFTQNLYIRQPKESHETKMKFSQVQSADFLPTPFHIPSDYTPADK